MQFFRIAAQMGDLARDQFILELNKYDSLTAEQLLALAQERVDLGNTKDESAAINHIQMERKMEDAINGTKMVNLYLKFCTKTG